MEIEIGSKTDLLPLDGKKNVFQEGVSKHHDLRCIWDPKLGGLEMQKQAFRVRRVEKYKVWAFREKASQMRSKTVPKYSKMEARGSIDSPIFVALAEGQK